MVPFLRIVAVLVAFYAVFASGSVAEETNTMVWALWIYGISIAHRIEDLNTKAKEATRNDNGTNRSNT